MPIIGYLFNTLNIERRKVEKVEKINPNINITFLNVERGPQENTLRIEFEFIVSYQPEIGEAKIEGEVFYSTKSVKKELNNWKKKRKISDEIALEVRNFLLRKCLTLFNLLSENFRLPLLPIPVITKVKKGS